MKNRGKPDSIRGKPDIIGFFAYFGVIDCNLLREVFLIIAVK